MLGDGGWQTGVQINTINTDKIKISASKLEGEIW